MRLMNGEKIIKSCRPNGHYVALVQGKDAEYFIVYSAQYPDDTGEPLEDEYEFDTRQEADNVYDSEVAELSGMRNFYAQAQYDDAHGTSNGYSDHDFRWEY